MAISFTTGSNISPFFAVSQNTVDILNSVTSLEKAKSVPYIKIVEIDTNTRLPKEGKDPINLELVQPPRFGNSNDNYLYRERPPVSLEKMTVTTQQSYGLILFSKVLLSFVIHRPDVIFSDDVDNKSNWKSIITAGTPHLIEYGWSSFSKNPLLSGEGVDDPDTKSFISSRKSFLFTVSTYSFSVKKDNQIYITVEGISSGDAALRDISIGQSSFVEEIPDNILKKGRVPAKQLDSRDSKNNAKALIKLQSDINKIKATKKIKKIGDLISFLDIANTIIAPVAESSLKSVGFESVELFMGNCNLKAGVTKDAYGNESMAQKSIGNILIPRNNVTNLLSRILFSGVQKITAFNFIDSMVNILNSPDIWRGDTSQAGTVKPRIHVKLSQIKDKGKQHVRLYIVDIKDNVIKFDPSENLNFKDKSRSDLLKEVRNRGIPIVSIGNALSFVEDNNFEVIMDERMRTIFIQSAQKSLKKRSEIVEQSDKEKRKNNIPPTQDLYRSTIQGKIQMLGNFIFDTFGTLWIDFRVEQWDGIFLITEREDSIDRSSFMTSISVISERSDPLGVNKE